MKKKIKMNERRVLNRQGTVPAKENSEYYRVNKFHFLEKYKLKKDRSEFVEYKRELGMLLAVFSI